MNRNEWIYATPAQETYLKRLDAQAFALLCRPFNLTFHRRLLKSDASRYIDQFKAAIAAAKLRRETNANANSENHADAHGAAGDFAR